MADAKALFASGAPASALFSKGQMIDSLKKTPENVTPPQPPERDLYKRLLDTFSDALPSTGAMVGGAAATPVAASLAVPSFGTSALLIPGGAAAGAGIGELGKRGLDYLTDRPNQLPPVTNQSALNTAGKGAVEGMNNFSLGQLLGKVAEGAKYSPGMATELAGKPTQFANLSGPAFESVRGEMGRPSPPIMAVPETQLARQGAEFATPRLAAEAQKGSRALQSIARPLQKTADIGREGAEAFRMANAAEQGLRSNSAALTDAKANALEELRPILKYDDPNDVAQVGTAWDKSQMSGRLAALQNRSTPAGNGPDIASLIQSSGGKPSASTAAAPVPPAPTVGQLPAGENVVVKTFNEPNSSTAAMTSKPFNAALDQVKSLGLESGALGGVRASAIPPALRASALGIGPEEIAAAQADADSLTGTAAALQRQRGGVTQGPVRGLPWMTYQAKKLITGPERTAFGFRPETPETAMANETPRMVELESQRRGLPPVNDDARSALDGLLRPTPAALSSDSGRMLSGAGLNAIGSTGSDTAELFRRLLSRSDSQKSQ